jgi:enamine deaminase RidA (YjgF/YER057c/UK114 family)
MPNFEILQPDGVHLPGGKYSHAAKISGGRLLVLAGQVPLDIDGNMVGEGDVGAQTPQVFQNIENVLKSAGGSFANVVEFTYYVVGRENVQGFIEARTGIFDKLYPDGGYPPATLLVIGGLANESFLLEVSALAVVS